MQFVTTALGKTHRQIRAFVHQHDLDLSQLSLHFAVLEDSAPDASHFKHSTSSLEVRFQSIATRALPTLAMHWSKQKPFFFVVQVSTGTEQRLESQPELQNTGKYTT